MGQIIILLSEENSQNVLVDHHTEKRLIKQFHTCHTFSHLEYIENLLIIRRSFLNQNEVTKMGQIIILLSDENSQNVLVDHHTEKRLIKQFHTCHTFSHLEYIENLLIIRRSFLNHNEVTKMGQIIILLSDENSQNVLVDHHTEKRLIKQFHTCHTFSHLEYIENLLIIRRSFLNQNEVTKMGQIIILLSDENSHSKRSG